MHHTESGLCLGLVHVWLDVCQLPCTFLLFLDPSFGIKIISAFFQFCILSLIFVPDIILTLDSNLLDRKPSINRPWLGVRTEDVAEERPLPMQPSTGSKT